MLVQVVGVSDPITQTGKNNKQYKLIEVEYTANGKKSTKKLTSYSPVYDLFSAAMPEQSFNVEVKKDGNFYNWEHAEPAGSDVQGETTPVSAPQAKDMGFKKTFTKRPESSYETPEERAARQELIVRQSSIASAIAFFDARGNPTMFNTQDILQTAMLFRDFVYQVSDLPSANSVNQTPRVQ